MRDAKEQAEKQLADERKRKPVHDALGRGRPREADTRPRGGLRNADHEAKILQRMGKESLASADDLLRFGELLREEPGFASPVGGLLIVHATIHGARPTLAKVS